MEKSAKRSGPAYFRLSSRRENHEFFLLIPARWRTDWTFGRLAQWCGMDPLTELSYIYKQTNERIDLGNAIRSL